MKKSSPTSCDAVVWSPNLSLRDLPLPSFFMDSSSARPAGSDLFPQGASSKEARDGVLFVAEDLHRETFFGALQKTAGHLVPIADGIGVRRHCAGLS